jgi:hypothetical protein
VSGLRIRKPAIHIKRIELLLCWGNPAPLALLRAAMHSFNYMTPLILRQVL